MKELYELKRLQGIIEKDISTSIELKQELFEAFHEEIKNETNRIKDNFSQAPLKLLTEQELKLYIRYHQQAIVRLEGHLLQYAEPQKISNTSVELDKSQLCRYLYFSLEELLAFVSIQFPQYFDADMWIPDRAKLILVYSINENFEALRLKLIKLGISNELLTLTLHPLNEFLSAASSNNVTYRKVIYLKEFQEALFEFLHGTHKNPTISLQWILFQLNYNTFEYFAYITRKISEDVDVTEDVKERMDKLARLQKHVHQNALKPFLAFNPTWNSTKQQLSDWISQEISYLDTRLILESDYPNERPETTAASTTKIKIELSVPQLAYLLRVFIEVGILQMKNLSLLLRHITKVFQTKRSDSLGYSSVQGKFYKPESSTKKAVRDLLLRMVSYIENSERLV